MSVREPLIFLIIGKETDLLSGPTTSGFYFNKALKIERITEKITVLPQQNVLLINSQQSIIVVITTLMIITTIQIVTTTFAVAVASDIVATTILYV